MTSPEDDDDLEEALRRALSEAVSEVEPGKDGLDKIRARIGDRPPRPWLSSVLVGLADRIRYWTWHGHWAWQESLPGLRALRERRSRRNTFPGWSIGWFRLVTILTGATVVASLALGRQPFRQAILQASTLLDGGDGPTPGSGAPEGDGTEAGGGSSTPATGGTTSGSGRAGPGSTAP